MLQLFRCGRVLVVASLLLLVGAIATAEPAHVEFWFHTSSEFEIETMERIVAQFHEEHKDIRVEIVKTGSISKAAMWEKLLAAIVGGVPPDLVYTDPQMIAEWGPTKGGFIPINEIMPVRLIEENDIIPAMTQVLNVRGKWWGLPFRTESRGLFYNLEMFEKAGLDTAKPPQTIEELDSYAHKLTLRDPSSNAIQQLGFYPYNNNDATGLLFLWVFGGDFFDWQALRPTLTRYPENFQAMNWIGSYAERYGDISPKSTDFPSGKQAMRIDSTTALANYPVSYPDLRFGMGRLPQPPGVPPTTLAGGVSLGIPSGAKNPLAAATFGLYLLKTDTQVMWYRGARSLPVRLSAIQRIGRLMDDPRERVLAGLLPYAKTTPPLGNQIRDSMKKHQARMRKMEISPEQVLHEVQRETEREYMQVFPN